MSVKLTQTIETYIAAANAGDAVKGSLCFSEDATVLDEGETLKGRKSIHDWMVKTRKKYNHTVRPLIFIQQAHESILTAEITGNFDGSPITLDYHFKIKNEQIEDLRVTVPRP